MVDVVKLCAFLDPAIGRKNVVDVAARDAAGLGVGTLPVEVEDGIDRRPGEVVPAQFAHPGLILSTADRREGDAADGIRPEDIIPSKRGDEYPEASKEFEARVSMAELLGCEYYLHFRTDSATLTSKVPLSKDLYKKDDSFFYRINLAKMHIFNAISEEAIF